MRALDIGKLKFIGSTKDAPLTLDALGEATLVQKVELGGTRYMLMCQPWRANSSGLKTWRLCGLVDGQRSFQQALEVAPQVVMLLLVLLTLALVSWPLLKILSLAPRERIGFADLYLMLLATLTLVMIFAVAAADIGTYAQLRERSRARLETLAKQIEGNLTTEFGQMYQQLRRYDDAVAKDAELRHALSEGRSRRVSCMLLAPEVRRQDATCLGSGVSLEAPTLYEPLDSVFWMRSCDGMQIIKGTVRRSNTPAVPLSARDYFQAVKQGRLWPSGYVVDTSASLTTGEFFAALAMPSQLRKSDQPPRPRSQDCSPAGRRALRRRPDRSAGFGPLPGARAGCGFAIADQDGRVMFHSDERRAVVGENLLADDGLTNRVRAALSARGHADFDAQYQTRPHQIHIQPMAGNDAPWFVMTFSDNEILRTVHIELLAQTGILLTLYLLLAFLGTLVYILFHGRAPPIWVWPRRQPLYRPLYCGTVWTLGAQHSVPARSRSAARCDAGRREHDAASDGNAHCRNGSAAALRLQTESPEAVESRQQRINALLIGAAALVVVVAFFAMDRVSAGQLRTGTETWILAVLLVVTAVAATVRKFTAINDPMWMRWWREPLGPHIIGTTIFWLLLGALPAYGLYKFALGMQMTLVTKGEQAYVGRAFAWRDCQIQNDFRQIPIPADHGAAQARRTDADSDVYLRAALSRDVELRPRRSASSPPTSARWAWRSGTPRKHRAGVQRTTTYTRYLEPFVEAPTRDGAGASRAAKSRSSCTGQAARAPATP